MDSTALDRRPELTEYAEFYRTYTKLVPERDVLLAMREAPSALEQLLTAIPADQEEFAYGPGKWTIREVIGHMVDAERLFSYRAMHIARGSAAPLPGMDQDDWAAASNAATRPLADHLAEFRALREANTRFFASLDATALARRGVASGVEVTVRALMHILVGHEIHHRGILAERYLPGLE